MQKISFLIFTYKYRNVSAHNKFGLGGGLEKDREGFGRGSLLIICLLSVFYLCCRMDLNTDRNQLKIKLYDANTTQTQPGYILCRSKAEQMFT